MISRRGVASFKHDRTDKGGGEGEAETEEWPLLRGFQDLTDVGQIDRHQKIVEGIVAESDNHYRGLFYHSVLQGVYTGIRQSTCLGTSWTFLQWKIQRCI